MCIKEVINKIVHFRTGAMSSYAAFPLRTSRLTYQSERSWNNPLGYQRIGRREKNYVAYELACLLYVTIISLLKKNGCCLATRS